MLVSSTSERINAWLQEHGLKQVDILKRAEPFCRMLEVKLNKNDLSQYVSGKTKPGQKKLYVLSLAMNVSEAWLMGYDVSPEREADSNIWQMSIFLFLMKQIQ